MSFVRAPSTLNLGVMIPTRHAAWVVIGEQRHVAELFHLPPELGGATNLRKTACGLEHKREQAVRIEQPCSKIPSDICPECRAWIEADFKYQEEHPKEALRCMHYDESDMPRKCEQPAKWVLFTQFSGNHPFCDEHAKAEENFGEEDPSYFFWKELSQEGGDEYERNEADWNSV